MKRIYQTLEALLFIISGGISYYFIEILYRGHSHYSMFLCGGIIFYFISLINRQLETRMPYIIRMIFSALIITAIEFLFGVIFNLILMENVWDYSDQAFHYKGQICLTFSLLWFFLSLPALYLEKKLRIIFHSVLKY